MKSTASQSILVTFFLTVIFFCSGFSSLMYQVAWQRLLTVYYGVGAVSTTLIVSVFMLGLGLGAWWGGRLVEGTAQRVKLYFWIELGIGLFGLISFPLLLLLGKYTAGAPYWVAGLYQFLFLCVPTFLMGMTLPVLTKIFDGVIANFLETVSWLYFINTLGAAVGTLFCSYVAISFWGIDAAIYIAAGMNFVLAGTIFILSRPEEISEKKLAVKSLSVVGGRIQFQKIHGIVFLTGFLAIGYEIIWFRVIGVLVKASPYAFASILSVYLLGIALGSLLMNRFLARRPEMDYWRIFFSLQVILGLTVALIFIGYYFGTKYTPFGWMTRFTFAQDLHPPLQLLFMQNNFGSWQGLITYLFFLGGVFIWPLFFVFLPTLVMGASFPVISQLALADKSRAGETIGEVYFYNILGNVAGGLVTGFVLLAHLGTEWTIILFCLGGLAFASGLRWPAERFNLKEQRVVLTVLTLLILLLLPKRGDLYALMHQPPEPTYDAYFAEGVEGTIMTYQRGPNVANYINGHSHGGRPGHFFYAQVLEAAGFAARAEDVFIIGFGTGSITEAALKMPSVKSVTLVELNETLIHNLMKMPVFKEILTHPKLRIVFDDGRRYLLREGSQFDLILMSPLRTTTAYSNNLYSQQSWELLNKHLRPGGVLVAWTDEYNVMSRTMANVFKDVRLYVQSGQGFYLTSNEQLQPRNPAQANALLQTFSPADQQQIAESRSRLKVLTLADLEPAMISSLANQDWKPRTEYYAGLVWKKFHQQ